MERILNKKFISLFSKKIPILKYPHIFVYVCGFVYASVCEKPCVDSFNFSFNSNI